MALTQSQMVAAVADRADMSRADAKRALDALDEIVLEELGSAQKVRLGGLVQLTVRVKPATTKRPGRNPATGEAITIAAKPASVDVRARRPGVRTQPRFIRFVRSGLRRRRGTRKQKQESHGENEKAAGPARQQLIEANPWDPPHYRERILHWYSQDNRFDAR